MALPCVRTVHDPVPPRLIRSKHERDDTAYKWCKLEMRRGSREHTVEGPNLETLCPMAEHGNQTSANRGRSLRCFVPVSANRSSGPHALEEEDLDLVLGEGDLGPGAARARARDGWLPC